MRAGIVETDMTKIRRANVSTRGDIAVDAVVVGSTQGHACVTGYPGCGNIA